MGRLISEKKFLCACVCSEGEGDLIFLKISYEFVEKNAMKCFCSDILGFVTVGLLCFDADFGIYCLDIIFSTSIFIRFDRSNFIASGGKLSFASV